MLDDDKKNFFRRYHRIICAICPDNLKPENCDVCNYVPCPKRREK